MLVKLTLKGHTILTGGELDAVVSMTYWHLKWAIDGYDGIQSTFSSVVSGKALTLIFYYGTQGLLVFNQSV